MRTDIRHFATVFVALAATGDLFDRNRTTMPPGKEGQLGAQDNAAITAFILQFNGFPAGPAEMPSQSMALKMIKYVADKP